MDDFVVGQVYTLDGKKGLWRYRGGDPDKRESWEQVETPEREAAYARLNERGGSAVGDFLRMAAQGATFGFADELAGLGAAVVPGGQGYEQARDASNQRVQDLRMLAPGASFASEVAGAVVPGIGIGRLGQLGAGRGGLAQALTSPMGASTGVGALTGAGESNEDRVTGGIIGGGLGAGVGVAGQLAGRYLRGPAGRAGEKIMRAVGIGSEAELAARAAEALPEERLVDFNARTQALGETVGTYPTDNAAALGEALSNRARQTPQRVADNLQARTGTPFENAAQTTRQLERNMKLRAAPLYDEAYQHTVSGKLLADHMHIPEFVDAYEQGVRLAMIGGVDIPRLPRLKTGAVDVKALSEREVPVQVIDYWKRGMDEMIERGMRSGGLGKTTARELRNRLRPVLAEVDEQVPIFREARETFAGDAALREAWEGGQAFARESPDEIAELLKEMTASEIAVYRRGAIAAVRESMGEVRDNRSVVDALFGKPNMRERARLLFADPAQAEAFLADMAKETNMHTSFLLNQKGSPTARRLGGRTDMEEGGAGDALAKVFHPRQSLEQGLRTGLNRMTTGPAVAEEVAASLNLPLNSDVLTPLLERMASEEARKRFGLAGVSGVLSTLGARRATSNR